MFFKEEASIRKALIGATLLLALSGCTKKVPYESEYKGMKDDGTSEAMSKDLISTGGEFIYNASSGEMSRKIAGGQPYSFGENKRVRLQFTPTSLRVIEQERDERYRRDVNDMVILEIPIEHVEFECSKDAFGECTSKEQEKTDIPWDRKSKFRLKASDVKLGAAELLPILDEQYYGWGYSCFTEVSSEVKSYSIQPNTINIEVKRVYNQNLNCMDSAETLSDTSVSAVFHYSLIKADSITSKGFKPISYDYDDEDTFGFFMTTHSVRDVDNSPMESGQIRWMNHWSPERTNIDYYLSDSFAKPENAYLKDLTYETVKNLNAGLKEAGAKFQVTLHDPQGKNPGDIRNSMIVLIEDPIASGPLGYGPQTEDPATGEIISARAMMFLAGFEQQTHYLYEEIGRVLKKAAADKIELKANIPKLKISEALQKKALMGNPAAKATISQPTIAQNSETPKRSVRRRIPNGTQIDIKKIEKELKALSRRKNPEYVSGDVKSYVRYLREAKNCAMPAEVGKISEMRPELALEIVNAYSDGKGGLRPWVSLNSAERQDLVKKVVSEIWIPVLLHELGHNMGLRHNFEGSKDTLNHYNEQELAQHQVSQKIPYSTIMEYGDDLHALPFLGKYDIAALRYGYGRQVEIQKKDESGNVVQSEIRDLNALNCPKPLVAGSIKCLQAQLEKENSAAGLNSEQAQKIGWNLHPYGYCTDEGEGSPGCHVFDEGATYSEIVDYMIQHYKDFYQLRNFRNDRENFSSFDDGAVMSGRYAALQDMRSFMELYETLKHTYGIADDHPAFESIEFFKDLKIASLKAARFFIEILQTPDTTCLIADKKDPTTVVVVASLEQIGALERRRLSCWEVDLSAGGADNLMVVGEVGKSFKNKKSLNSHNAHVDQIDVRGFYVDKIAAARALFRRNMTGSLSVFNDHWDNAWDIADLHEELQATVQGLLTNKMISTQIATLADGTQIPITTLFDYHSSQVIDQPLWEGVSRQLGTRFAPVYFSEVLSGEVAKEATANADNRVEGEKLKSMVSVRIQNDFDQKPQNPLLSVDLGAGRWAFVSSSNVVGLDLMKDLQLQRVLRTALKESKENIIPAEVVAPKRRNLKRDGFPLLMKVVNEKVQNSQELTQEDLDTIPSLTKQEKAGVWEFASAFGTKELATRAQQLADESTLPENDIIKILEYLPKF